MKGTYKISWRADKDIGYIIEYTFRNLGEKQAATHRTSLNDCFELLAANPFIGRHCEQIRLDHPKPRFPESSHLLPQAQG